MRPESREGPEGAEEDLGLPIDGAEKLRDAREGAEKDRVPPLEGAENDRDPPPLLLPEPPPEEIRPRDWASRVAEPKMPQVTRIAAKIKLCILMAPPSRWSLRGFFGLTSPKKLLQQVLRKITEEQDPSRWSNAHLIVRSVRQSIQTRVDTREMTVSPWSPG